MIKKYLILLFLSFLLISTKAEDDEPQGKWFLAVLVLVAPPIYNLVLVSINQGVEPFNFSGSGSV